MADKNNKKLPLRLQGELKVCIVYDLWILNQNINQLDLNVLESQMTLYLCSPCFMPKPVTQSNPNGCTSALLVSNEFWKRNIGFEIVDC